MSADGAPVPTTERRPLDGYYTTPELAEALTRLLLNDGWWQGGFILEPSAGKGAFVDAAMMLQPQYIRAIDIDPERCAELRKVTIADVHQGDFLEQLTDRPFELVLGNPPFSGAEKHVVHALHKRARFGVVAFLLRLGFLESRERIPFWREHPASKIYVLSERPSFTGGGTDNSAYGFYVWATWHRGPTELEVVSWREPKKRNGKPDDCRPPIFSKTPAECGQISTTTEAVESGEAFR